MLFFKPYLIITLTLALCSMPLVYAEEKALSRSTYQSLIQIEKQLDKNPTLAVQQLKTVLINVKQKPYDKAIVEQQLAYAFLSIEDYSAAYEMANSAVKSNQLPEKISHQLYWLLAQLSYQLKRYAEVPTFAKQGLSSKTPQQQAQAYYLMGSSQYQLKNLKQAIQYLETAIKKAQSVPLEWQKLLLASYMEIKHYRKAEKILHRLVVKDSTDPTWWQYLISIYLEMEREDKALATLILAGYKSKLDEKNITRLMQLYNFNNLPYKAAIVLQKQLEGNEKTKSYKNLKLLAQLWMAARERTEALRVYTQAAAMSPSGKDDLIIGQLYMELGDWQSSVKAFNRAIKKGGIKNTEHVRFLAGVAAYYSKEYKSSRNNFKKLQQSPIYREQASYWLAKLEWNNNIK